MTHDELRKLCEEASPEPWVGWVLPSRSASDGPERGGVSGLPFINYDRCTYFKPQDARFIAAARTAVPALLDELERVYAVMEADTRAIYWLSNGIDIRNYHYRLGDCPWIVSKNGWPDGVTKNPNEINLACGSCHGKGMPLYKDGPTIPCSGCWIDHEQESFKKAIRYPTIQAALARAWELERGA